MSEQETATAEWPAWVNKWRPAIQQAHGRRAAEVAARKGARDEAIVDAGTRAAAAYQLLKPLDGRTLDGGVVLRVGGPRPEYGEGRTVKLTVGGVPVAKLAFGFVPNPGDGRDVGKHFSAHDEMTCLRGWVDSAGRPWESGESRQYSERDLAEFLLHVCG